MSFVAFLNRWRSVPREILMGMPDLGRAKMRESRLFMQVRNREVGLIL